MPRRRAMLALALGVSTSAAKILPVAAQPGPPPDCPAVTSCGDVDVPYPFGIGTNCSLPGFDLICDRTRLRLLLGNDSTLQVAHISLEDSTVHVVDRSGAVKITHYGPLDGNGTWVGLGSRNKGITFDVARHRNHLVVTGCNVQVTLLGDRRNVITGCSSFCAYEDILLLGNGTGLCTGIGCCETPVPIEIHNYTVELKYLNPNHDNNSKVPLADRHWFGRIADEIMLKRNQNMSAELTNSHLLPVPMVLDWVVAATPVVPGAKRGNSSCPTDTTKSACRSSHSSCNTVTNNYRTGYVCLCKDGYKGNPYLDDGCQDIDECALQGKCFGVCTNTAGGYECRCPRGARGDPNIPNGCTKSTLGEPNLFHCALSYYNLLRLFSVA
ncbi:hypothetical protein QOZ80_1BG0055550 [Eleusine coracana subsp. coracana]|nr:hypothetical protein QOZ80_1BG0055550 [Eleusine coracana subsp. coracana]